MLSPRSVVVLQEHGAVDVVLRASFGRDDTEAFAGARLVQRRNILVLAKGSIVLELRQERVDDERNDEPLLDDEDTHNLCGQRDRAWRRSRTTPGGTHWFSSTGINDDDFKFAKAVKKAAAKASATDEL